MNKKEKIETGIAVPSAVAVYGLENFLEYITLKNEYIASGIHSDRLYENFNFFDWNVDHDAIYGGWSSDKMTNFDYEALTADLKDKIDYNAALAPNTAVGIASGLVGVLAAKKGNKPVAIMGAAVNAASLVNLLAKGTELAQRSEKPFINSVGATIYTSAGSALPLYLAGIIAEAGLLAVTAYFLAKNTRKEYKEEGKPAEFTLGLDKSEKTHNEILAKSDPAELRPDELLARRRALHP